MNKSEVNKMKPVRCLCLCEISRYHRVWKEGTRITVENPLFPGHIVFVEDDLTLWYTDKEISFAPLSSGLKDRECCHKWWTI